MDECLVKNSCRICLKKLKSFEKYVSIREKHIQLFLTECLSVKLDENAFLPDKICTICSNFIEFFQKFRVEFQKVQRTLSTWMQHQGDIETFNDENTLSNTTLWEKLSDTIDIKYAFREDQNVKDVFIKEEVLEPSSSSSPSPSAIKVFDKSPCVRTRSQTRPKTAKNSTKTGPRRNSIDNFKNNDFETKFEQTDANEQQFPTCFDDLSLNAPEIRENNDVYDSEKLYCIKCSTNFSCINSLKDHLVRKHRISRDTLPRKVFSPTRGTFRCNLTEDCGVVTNKLTSFIVHVRTKHKKLKHNILCEFCNDKYLVDEQLQVHLRRRHFSSQLQNVNELNRIHCRCPLKECQNGVDDTNVTELMTINELGGHLKRVHTYTPDKARKICVNTINEIHKAINGKCVVCGARDANLKKHMAQQHQFDINGVLIQFVCKLCPEKFVSRKVFTHHKKKVHRKDKICHLCGILYSGNDHYLKHADEMEKLDGNVAKLNESKEEIQKRTCVYCNKPFSTVYSMRSHVKYKHGNKPLVKCPHCETMVKAYTLTHHVKYAHSNRQMPCTVCEKICKTNSSLKVHMRLHTGERPYVCKYCNQTFRKSGVLKNHVRRHTGERPHVCHVCDKRFIQKTGLKTHMRTHTNNRNTIFSRATEIKNS